MHLILESSGASPTTADSICDDRRDVGPLADDAHAPAGDLARCALIGGNGAVGRLFAGALAAAGCELLIADLAPDPHPEASGLGAYASLDACRPSPELRSALADIDCALLAVPEAVALDALPHVLAALPPGALLADTLSVKTPFAQAARAAAAPVELLGLNPMFAPSLGFADHAVLAVELAPGPRSRALLALLRERTTVVVADDEAAHDRATAALQVAAHASILTFGVALARMGTDLGALLPLAPPPFLALVALLARIADGSPATYADIQRANPYAAEARATLAVGLTDLDAAALADDPARFGALLSDIHELLGDDRDALAAQAAALLAQLRPPR